MKKSIFSILLVIAILSAMSMTSFAATFDSDSNIVAGTKCINLYGTGSYAYNGRNVTMYAATGSADQLFSIKDIGNGLKVYTPRSDRYGNTYTLNAYTVTYNCTVYKDVITNNNDSVVHINGAVDSFTIDLDAHDGYELTHGNDNVGWGGTTITYWVKN